MMSLESYNLDHWIHTTHDQRENPEEESVQVEVSQMMAENHQKNMLRKSLSLDAESQDHVKYWEKTLLQR